MMAYSLLPPSQIVCTDMLIIGANAFLKLEWAMPKTNKTAQKKRPCDSAARIICDLANQRAVSAVVEAADRPGWRSRTLPVIKNSRDLMTPAKVFNCATTQTSRHSHLGRRHSAPMLADRWACRLLFASSVPCILPVPFIRCICRRSTPEKAQAASGIRNHCVCR